VYYAPAPVVYMPPPVVYMPAPVYYAPRPVYMHPARSSELVLGVVIIMPRVITTRCGVIGRILRRNAKQESPAGIIRRVFCF
jgi:hypothetical protein